MIRLRQSTASQEVPLGVFVDAGDGGTPETGLTIASTDIKLWKNGGITVVAKNDAAGATHRADGVYTTTLDATDTATIGPMWITVAVAGARPVRVECEVLAAALFDSLFGTVGIAADTKALAGDLLSVARLTTFAYTIGTAVCHLSESQTATSIVINRAVSNPELCSVVNQLRNKRIRFTMNDSNQDGIMTQSARIVASTAWSGSFPNEIATLTVEPALALVPLQGDILAIVDGPDPGITEAGHVKASVEAVQENTTAALILKLQALAGARGTLAAGSTNTVLNIATFLPAMVDANQIRGRVLLVVDDAASEPALKIQGSRIALSTTGTITLEQALTRPPAAGNVFVIL